MSIKKLFVLFLLVVCVCSACAPAMAEEIMPVEFSGEIEAYADNGIEPFASTIISSCTARITMGVGGRVNGSAVIDCKKAAYRCAVFSVSIQEYSGGTWRTVATGYGSAVSNGISASASVSYNGTAGVQYRVIATCYAQETSSSTTEYRYPQTSGYPAQP